MEGGKRMGFWMAVQRREDKRIDERNAIVYTNCVGVFAGIDTSGNVRRAGKGQANEVIRSFPMEPGMENFEWDKSKRLANIAKHGIDFIDVDILFVDERSVVYPSPRHDEERFVLVGLLNLRLISVVFTRRGETIRIISARISRKGEKALWLRNVSKHS
jgi:uncharacterized DUF497 family protein